MYSIYCDDVKFYDDKVMGNVCSYSSIETDEVKLSWGEAVNEDFMSQDIRRYTPFSGPVSDFDNGMTLDGFMASSFPSSDVVYLYNYGGSLSGYSHWVATPINCTEGETLILPSVLDVYRILFYSSTPTVPHNSTIHYSVPQDAELGAVLRKVVYRKSTGLFRNDMVLITPKLTLKEGAAGTLDFILPPVNRVYSDLRLMGSTIKVKRDGNEIWRGRPLSKNVDFNQNFKITCEGALAFLNDTIQEPFTHDGSAKEFFQAVLSTHNANAGRVNAEREIFCGAIENENAYLTLEVGYVSTLDAINDALEILGGTVYVEITIDGKAYLNYNRGLTTSYEDCDQNVTFGKNMLDMSKDYDMTEFVSTIYPRGTQDSETGEYVTVESVNDGDPYVSNSTLAGNYGRVEKVIDFSEIDNATELLEAAEEYVNSLPSDIFSIELSAVDLNYLGVNTDHFDLYKKVLCKSWAHEMSGVKLPITAMEIDFADPSKTKITLGRSDKRINTVDSYVSNKVSKTVDSKIENAVPTIVNQTVNQKLPDIIEITNEKVVSADIIMSTFCFSRYILTEFLETNFDAIDGRHSTHHAKRNYIKIYDNTIQFLEADITDNKVQYRDHAGTLLYWTSVDTASVNKYKYFTYESPLTIAKDKRPEGMSEDDFVDLYRVWVYETENEYIKGEIGFPSNGSTGEPKITLGAGSGTGDDGKGFIFKSTDDLNIMYQSRTDHTLRGIKIGDDGNIKVFQDSKDCNIWYGNWYSSLAEAEAARSRLPLNAMIGVVSTTS